jgi:hypothetical protein
MAIWIRKSGFASRQHPRQDFDRRRVQQRRQVGGGRTDDLLAQGAGPAVEPGAGDFVGAGAHGQLGMVEVICRLTGPTATSVTAVSTTAGRGSGRERGERVKPGRGGAGTASDEAESARPLTNNLAATLIGSSPLRSRPAAQQRFGMLAEESRPASAANRPPGSRCAASAAAGSRSARRRPFPGRPGWPHQNLLKMPRPPCSVSVAALTSSAPAPSSVVHTCSMRSKAVAAVSTAAGLGRQQRSDFPFRSCA